MAVGVSADHHQLDQWIVEYFIKVAGEMNMGILRRLLLGLRPAAVNVRYLPAVFAVQNVRKVIAGGAFTKANKCAVQSHNAVLS